MIKISQKALIFLKHVVCDNIGVLQFPHSIPLNKILYQSYIYVLNPRVIIFHYQTDALKPIGKFIDIKITAK